LLPRSGLERSDFVHWHEPDQSGRSPDVQIGFPRTIR
jgi:hypothetical protein